MTSEPPKTYCIPEGRGVPNFETSHARMSEDVYREVLRSLPILCADVFPYHRASRTLWLPWRLLKPATGWWCIGGRVLIGEDGVAAAARHCEADTGMRIDPARFEFLYMQNYLCHEREQEPQDTPCHTFSYCFAVNLDESELARFGSNLAPPEYQSDSFRAFGRAEIRSPGMTSMLGNIYDRIFGPA